MEENYKYCKRCEIKVSLNATQCLVCGGREFVTQEEADKAAEMLINATVNALNYLSSPQNERKVGLWERFKRWIGAT